ncbi:MAG: peptide ABC transporter substrate-binding protein [Chitinophagales bacterium]
MIKRIGFLLMMITLLQACGGGEATNEEQAGLTPGKGGVYFGGTLKLNEVEYFKTLYPLNITEVTGHRTITQIYEGLVGFVQKDLSIEPVLAESWDISEDGKTYTFHIRKGVTFHDDPCFPGGKGRAITANDFKYCFDRACYYNPANNQGYTFAIDVIKGAQEYFDATKEGNVDPNGVSGVSVIDDYTLQIELIKPFSAFLSRLALPWSNLYPKEAVEKYGAEMRTHTVGTGPFTIKALKEDQVIFLEKNKNYWGKDEFGNQLPYLDLVKISFINDNKKQLEQFEKGELDMVYRIPLEAKDNIVDIDDNLLGKYQQYQLQARPVLAIQYYGFLNVDPVFKSKEVRQAFCYAIDREKICDFTLKGTGFPANYGIIPPGTGSYDATRVNGYKFNPEKAQELMAKAGYKNGEGFPSLTLQINSGGKRNESVAEAVEKMLEENLNIDIEIARMPFAQHTEAVESAKFQFWRLGWVADYPDPENFLTLFDLNWYQPDLSIKSYKNSFRYKSEEFDQYFKAALATTDEEERNILYAKADQVVIDDAVCLPIFYDKDYRLVQPDVKNFYQNAMEYRNAKDVYFVPEN